MPETGTLLPDESVMKSESSIIPSPLISKTESSRRAPLSASISISVDVPPDSQGLAGGVNVVKIARPKRVRGSDIMRSPLAVAAVKLGLSAFIYQPFFGLARL